MHSKGIIHIIRESSRQLKQDYDGATLTAVDSHNRHYEDRELSEFMRDLQEAGNRMRIIYLENRLKKTAFADFLHNIDVPIITFGMHEGQLIPLLVYTHKRKHKVMQFTEAGVVPYEDTELPELYHDEEDQVIFLAVFSYKSLVSDDADETEKPVALTPVQRLLRLLSEEKKDIFYIYVYAVLIGLISLTLPLGIQATIGLISGGVFFSSVYILIGLVIAGVLTAGGLQVMQITLVEYLQRRIFTKAAFEFAFRVPRIRGDALYNYYAPELMNRFFDVLTIQKGLPKLLIDLSAGVIQILFGLILLSFYHPFFVFFSMALVFLLIGIFYFTGPQGLSSSIKESKFKYRVVYWLEEIARTINSFKLSGNTALPLRKTDYNVNNYLKNRKAHFRVLISQYSYVLLFKALVTGGLLIIGTILVVEREITLGQFVASEVIIILTISSVEKIIMYMDVVYDMLTAVDKIANVTDLPLERSGGIDIDNPVNAPGFGVSTKNLSYRFPGATDYALKDVDLFIKSGEKVCIAGEGGSGKSVLVNTISGLNVGYEGIITIDGFSLRDLDLTNLRDKIGKNVSREDIFEGTILENILLAKPKATPKVAIEILNRLNIADEVNAMPDGLNTVILSGGKGLSDSLINKLILARCLAKRPRMLILNDFFDNFLQGDRSRLMDMIMEGPDPCTLIVVSNDPMLMRKCDKVIVMQQGKIAHMGSYEELYNANVLSNLME